ncbi:hypothetical protein ACK6VM_07590 [Citrobacter meridianamericanus]
MKCKIPHLALLLPAHPHPSADDVFLLSVKKPNTGVHTTVLAIIKKLS